MAKLSEVDAIKKVDEALEGIEDKEALKRILRWAYEKYCPGTSIPDDRVEEGTEEEQTFKNRGKKKTVKKIKKKGKSKKSALSIDKTLNLKPSGKTSFTDFAAEKNPSTDREKVVLCVYYLLNKLGKKPIGINQVYTCYKLINWRVPADLTGTLRWVSSQKGWLDTSDSLDIKMTTHGENLIEHDLPPKKIAKKA
ncbi:MAG TPA: hypothetical protein ACFYD7_13175 [Candidatus Wujingus californicus]|uniref:hypothetical protein n=1 Tax=Candidatus Wujingus californicus TaxID=3367618 RepID=UPI0027129120|nr:hypothetical protein [Planctomycetota bacterium]MDO8094862.1 hypothetical protein [Candidatus Brocadiales bacterium]